VWLDDELTQADIDWAATVGIVGIRMRSRYGLADPNMRARIERTLRSL
jgi:hypothetical protein